MSDKALRFNTGKLPWLLLPVEICVELIKVFWRGSFKYAPNNWMRSVNTADHEAFKHDRLESTLRHIQDIREGKRFDEEVIPGAEHIKVYSSFCAAWNLCVYGFYELMEDHPAPQSVLSRYGINQQEGSPP